MFSSAVFQILMSARMGATCAATLRFVKTPLVVMLAFVQEATDPRA